MNKRAVIYCRVSTKEQIDNNSLSLQEKDCRKYCEREGFEVVKVFIEKGESAKTADRTELKKLLEFCEQNKKNLNAVIFNEPTRFSRDTLDYLILKKQLKSLGIAFKSPNLVMDESSDSYLKEMFNVLMGDIENKKKAERTIRGMKESATLGRWNHKPPLGYISGLDAFGKKTILSDKENAPFIKMAFESFSESGHTKQAVLNKLTEKGFRERNGKKISPQHFDKILRNPIYAGWNIEKKWAIKERGNWEPLINVETYDKTQAKLNRKTPLSARKKINPDFPLRGYALCFACGQPLTASWSKGKNKNKKFGYYYCQKNDCRKTFIPKDEAETMFTDAMRRVKLQPEVLKKIAKWLNEQAKKGLERDAKLSEQLIVEINQLRRQKQRFVEARFIDGTLDQNTYQEQVNRIGLEISQREETLESLTKTDIFFDIEQMFFHANLHYFELLNIPWHMGDIEEKQKIQRLLWPKGAKIEKGNYQTPETPDILKLINEFDGKETSMVAPRGIEPRFNG